jgi:tetratricopeptide (TPR) repeat protein
VQEIVLEFAAKIHKSDPDLMSNQRIEILKRYLEEDPRDAFSAYALGLELLKMNELNEALAIFEQLIALSPDYLATYYQLGKLYEKLSQPTPAKTTYETGILVAKKQNNRHTQTELQTALDILCEGEED